MWLCTVRWEYDMRLLLIEDSELLQERVLESLAELAPNVLPHTAQTQDDAIQLLRQHQYDLVIADIELAQGNGLDVIRYARTHLPPNHSPVFVVLSNHTYFHYRKIAQQLGVQHFFDKSLQFDQAIQVVGHMAQRVDSQMK